MRVLLALAFLSLAGCFSWQPLANYRGNTQSVHASSVRVPASGQQIDEATVTEHSVTGYDHRGHGWLRTDNEPDLQVRRVNAGGFVAVLVPTFLSTAATAFFGTVLVIVATINQPRPGITTAVP